MMIRHTVTKTFGHDLGLSASFRQWRASSHCSFIHGYALAVEVEIGCAYLDERNWVFDFGAFDQFKVWLRDTFDHKTLVARDDPMLVEFKRMAYKGIFDLVEVEATGCEAFAEMIAVKLGSIISQVPGGFVRDLRPLRVTVKEHGANAATYHFPRT
jgi:6-pyruvoyltetrahydropterin/6-carboxytetrahydropterin synthase